MRATESDELALFPLQAVLFPGGRLSLKVFEARYLDLIGQCLREQRPFGVVMLKSGHEVRRADEHVAFEPLGTLAELIDVDSDTPGILHVTSRGGTRFTVRQSRQRPDGLWLARTDAVADNALIAPSAAQLATVRGLQEAIASLKAQGVSPFFEPF
ncbi:MAG: LON peptidase substrate-binding domain-containing protein, partial [Rhizobacter sp.]